MTAWSRKTWKFCEQFLFFLERGFLSNCHYCADRAQNLPGPASPLHLAHTVPDFIQICSLSVELLSNAWRRFSPQSICNVGSTGDTTVYLFSDATSHSFHAHIGLFTFASFIAPKPYICHQNSPHTDSLLYCRNAHNRCRIMHCDMNFDTEHRFRYGKNFPNSVLKVYRLTL